MAYTFTDPETGTSYTLDHPENGFYFAGPTVQTHLGRELLRVVEERQYETSKLIGLEDERHHLVQRIAALEAEVERLKGLEWSARQSLTETAGLKDRAKALAEENARLRAEVAFLGPARRLAAAGVSPDDTFKAVVDQQQRFDAELSGIREVMVSGAREERAAVLTYLEEASRENYGDGDSRTGELLEAIWRDISRGEHLRPSSSCTTPPETPPTPPR